MRPNDTGTALDVGFDRCSSGDNHGSPSATQAAGYSVPSLSGVSLLQIPRRLAFCQKKHECMCIGSMWMWARTEDPYPSRSRASDEARDPRSGKSGDHQSCCTPALQYDTTAWWQGMASAHCLVCVSMSSIKILTNN